MPSWYDPSAPKNSTGPIDPNNMSQNMPRPDTQGAWVELTKGADKGKIVFHYAPVPEGDHVIDQAELAELMANGSAKIIANNLAVKAQNAGDTGAATVDPNGVRNALAGITQIQVNLPGQTSLPGLGTVHVNKDGQVIIPSRFGDGVSIHLSDVDQILAFMRTSPLMTRVTEPNVLYDNNGVQMISSHGAWMGLSSILHLLHDKREGINYGIRQGFDEAGNRQVVDSTRDMGEMWADVVDNSMDVRTERQRRDARERDRVQDEGIRNRGLLPYTMQPGASRGQRQSALRLVSTHDNAHIKLLQAFSSLRGDIPLKVFSELITKYNIGQVNFGVKNAQGKFVQYPHQVLARMFDLSEYSAEAFLLAAMLNGNRTPEEITNFIRLCASVVRGDISPRETASDLTLAYISQDQIDRVQKPITTLPSNEQWQKIENSLITLNIISKNIFDSPSRTGSQSVVNRMSAQAIDAQIFNFMAREIAPDSSGNYSGHIQKLQELLQNTVRSAIENNMDDAQLSPDSVVSYNQSQLEDTWQRIFSNLSPTPFLFEGITVPTAEHLYQALKFKKNPDGSFSPIQREILKQETPILARTISRQYTTGFPAELVAPRANASSLNHDIEIMRFILRKKYDSSPGFRDALRQSGKLIVQKSKFDNVWAVKLNTQTMTDFSGKNILGKLLMELKKEKFGNNFQGTLSSAAAEVERFLAGIEEFPNTRLDAALGLFSDTHDSSGQFSSSQSIENKDIFKVLLTRIFPVNERRLRSKHEQLIDKISQCIEKYRGFQSKNSSVIQAGAESLTTLDFVALALSGLGDSNLDDNQLEKIQKFIKMLDKWGLLDDAATSPPKHVLPTRTGDVITLQIMSGNNSRNLILTDTQKNTLLEGMNALGIVHNGETGIFDWWHSGEQEFIEQNPLLVVTANSEVVNQAFNDSVLSLFDISSRDGTALWPRFGNNPSSPLVIIPGEFLSSFIMNSSPELRFIHGGIVNIPTRTGEIYSPEQFMNENQSMVISGPSFAKMAASLLAAAHVSTRWHGTSKMELSNIVEQNMVQRRIGEIENINQFLAGISSLRHSVSPIQNINFSIFSVGNRYVSQDRAGISGIPYGSSFLVTARQRQGNSSWIEIIDQHGTRSKIHSIRFANLQEHPEFHELGAHAQILRRIDPEYDHISHIISECEQRIRNIEYQEPSTLTESVISGTDSGTQIDMSKLWKTDRFSESPTPLGRNLKIAFLDIMDQVRKDGQWNENTANAFSEIFGDKLHYNLQNLLVGYQYLNNENISIDESEIFEEHLKRLFKEQERKNITFVGFDHANYPALWKGTRGLYDSQAAPRSFAPAGIYVLGNKSLISPEGYANSISLVNDPIPVPTQAHTTFRLGTDEFNSLISVSTDLNYRKNALYAASDACTSLVNVINAATSWGVYTEDYVPFCLYQGEKVTFQQLGQIAEEFADKIHEQLKGRESTFSVNSTPSHNWDTWTLAAKDAVKYLVEQIDQKHRQFIQEKNINEIVKKILTFGKNIVVSQVGPTGAAFDHKRMIFRGSVTTGGSLDKDIYRIARGLQYGYEPKDQSADSAVEPDPSYDVFSRDNYRYSFNYLGYNFKSVEAAIAATMFAHPLLDRVAPDYDRIFEYFSNCNNSLQVKAAIEDVLSKTRWSLTSSWNGEYEPFRYINLEQYISAFNEDGSAKSDWQRNAMQILHEIMITRILQHQSLQQMIRSYEGPVIPFFDNNHPDDTNILNMTKNILLGPERELGGLIVVAPNSSMRYPMRGVDSHRFRTEATTLEKAMKYGVPWQNAYGMLVSSAPRATNMSVTVVSPIEPLVMDLQKRDAQWIQKTEENHSAIRLDTAGNETGTVRKDEEWHKKNVQMMKLGLARSLAIIQLSARGFRINTRNPLFSSEDLIRSFQSGGRFVNDQWQMMGMLQQKSLGISEKSHETMQRIFVVPNGLQNITTPYTGQHSIMAPSAGRNNFFLPSDVYAYMQDKNNLTFDPLWLSTGATSSVLAPPREKDLMSIVERSLFSPQAVRDVSVVERVPFSSQAVQNAPATNVVLESKRGVGSYRYGLSFSDNSTTTTPQDIPIPGPLLPGHQNDQHSNRVFRIIISSNSVSNILGIRTETIGDHLLRTLWGHFAKLSDPSNQDKTPIINDIRNVWDGLHKIVMSNNEIQSGLYLMPDQINLRIWQDDGRWNAAVGAVRSNILPQNPSLTRNSKNTLKNAKVLTFNGQLVIINGEEFLQGSFDVIPSEIEAYFKNPVQYIDQNGNVTHQIDNLHQWLVEQKYEYLLSPVFTIDKSSRNFFEDSNYVFVPEEHQHNESFFGKLSSGAHIENPASSNPYYYPSYMYYGSGNQQGIENSLKSLDSPILDQSAFPTNNNPSVVVMENFSTLSESEKNQVIAHYLKGTPVVVYSPTEIYTWRLSNSPRGGDLKKYQNLGGLMIRDGFQINSNAATFSIGDVWLGALATDEVLGGHIRRGDFNGSAMITSEMRKELYQEGRRYLMGYKRGEGPQNSVFNDASIFDLIKIVQSSENSSKGTIHLVVGNMNPGFEINGLSQTQIDHFVLTLGRLKKGESQQESNANIFTEKLLQSKCVKLATLPQPGLDTSEISNRIASVIKFLEDIGLTNSQIEMSLNQFDDALYSHLAAWATRRSATVTAIGDLSENPFAVAAEYGSDGRPMTVSNPDRSAGRNVNLRSTHGPLARMGRETNVLPILASDMDLSEPDSFQPALLFGQRDESSNVWGSGLYTDSELFFDDTIYDAQGALKVIPVAHFSRGEQGDRLALMPSRRRVESSVNLPEPETHDPQIITIWSRQTNKPINVDTFESGNPYAIRLINNFKIIVKYSYASYVYPGMYSTVSIGRSQHNVGTDSNLQQIDTYYIVETFVRFEEKHIKVAEQRYIQPYRFLKDNFNLQEYYDHEKSVSWQIGRELLAGVATNYLTSFPAGKMIDSYPKGFAPGINPVGTQTLARDGRPLPESELMTSDNHRFLMFQPIKSQRFLFSNISAVSSEKFMPIANRSAYLTLKPSNFQKNRWILTDTVADIVKLLTEDFISETVTASENRRIFSMIVNGSDQGHDTNTGNTSGSRPFPFVIGMVGSGEASPFHNIGKLKNAYKNNPEIQEAIEVNSKSGANDFTDMLVNIINSIAQNEQDVSAMFSINSPYRNTTLVLANEDPVLQPSEDYIDIVHAFLLNVLSRRGMMISIPNSWISLKIVPALMIKNATPDGIPDIPIRVDSPFVILGDVDVLRFITPLTWGLGIGSDFSREQIFSDQRAEIVQSTKKFNIDALPENMQRSAFMVMNTQANTNDFRFKFCNALLMNVIHGKRVFGESSPNFISESPIFQDKLRALVRSENVDPQNIDNLVEGFLDHICQSLGYKISEPDSVSGNTIQILNLVQKRAIAFAALYARAASMPTDFDFYDISDHAQQRRSARYKMQSDFPDQANDLMPPAPLDAQERAEKWKLQAFLTVIDDAYRFVASGQSLIYNQQTPQPLRAFSPISINDQDLQSSIALLSPYKPSDAPQLNQTGMHFSPSPEINKRNYAQNLIEMHDQYSYNGSFFTLYGNFLCATVQGQLKSLNDYWTLTDILNLNNFSMQTPIAITFENLADIIANTPEGLLPAWINNLTWANAPVGPRSPAFSASIIRGIFKDSATNAANDNQATDPDGSFSPEEIRELLANAEQRVRTLMDARMLASVGKNEILILTRYQHGGSFYWKIQGETFSVDDHSGFLDQVASDLNVKIATGYDIGQAIRNVFSGSNPYLDLMKYMSNLATSHKTVNASTLSPQETKRIRERQAIRQRRGANARALLGGFGRTIVPVQPSRRRKFQRSFSTIAKTGLFLIKSK